MKRFNLNICFIVYCIKQSGGCLNYIPISDAKLQKNLSIFAIINRLFFI